MMKRMKIVNGKPTKRFEMAWGPRAIEYERELQPTRWLCLGMRERDCYSPLRCFARSDSRTEVEALGPLAAILAERGNKKLEFAEERALTNWALVIYPPLRERDDEPMPEPAPTAPAFA
jgi:hypothetical protein